MTEDDLYSILGVLPDAEDVVIVGAYRALAKRYHPDRWAGDPSEAHRRMAQINRAYGVLGDASQRAAYDKARTRSQQAEFTQNDDYGEAFTSALAGVEERWKIACGVYPDLLELRVRLARISTALAFAFVTTLLETKKFQKRAQVASHLETAFLERYFGSNPQIVDYARTLILEGQKAAAKALNQLVDVLGSEVDANLLIARVDKEFGLDVLRASRQKELADRARIKKLVNRVLNDEDHSDAHTLANLLGYAVREVGAGFFKGMAYEVVSPTGATLRFPDSLAFVEWAKNTLCVDGALP